MANRVVLVSGGLGTLGGAVVTRFRADGERVAVLDKASASAATSVGRASTECVLGGIELTDAAATRLAVDKVVAALGGIDVLVNVAGGFTWEKQSGGGLDAWDAMYAMNLKSAVVLTQACLPHLQKSQNGKIVFIGAGAAAGKAAAGMAPYTASKAGIHKLTESLADELKDQGISVNAVLPGTIDTPQNRCDMPDADFSRWVLPAQLAAVVAFLASSAADAVTGALIPVNGRG